MEQEKQKKREASYEELFLIFGKRVEKVLAVMVILLFVALMAAQLLLQNAHVRYLLVKVEQLEGNPYRADGSKAMEK
ncbi:DUF5359 family protein [Paenibacillus cremeus]|uniref:Uncharacterized protein n=1 Tax=Paenibacillus cremeus TaxID=2163881 RepID=A0A559KHJ0_9BACL|nr:DUF5359 family protein [Paenibacillus cremeus]TVY11589.1 hypothetical protein FPZ49_02485 [Paenibacillus cremeus]